LLRVDNNVGSPQPGISNYILRSSQMFSFKKCYLEARKNSSVRESSKLLVRYFD